MVFLTTFYSINLLLLSHLAQRNERNCLNCNTYVVGKYCHNCGQENIELKESVWHLLSHLFKDITHFDGKFFTSMKDLIWKPGFLSLEYMRGRRVAYLNPIRMYLFTSFIFFLIFFSLYKIDGDNLNVGIIGNKIDKMDSGQLKQYREKYNNGILLKKREMRKRIFDTASIQLLSRKYRSMVEYDSTIKAGKKYNWLEKQLVYKNIELNKKYKNKPGSLISDLSNKLQHSIPQMLFVLLPLFALLLKLLYIRRKNFYYTDHAIFTIHFYIFVFIDMLLIFGISKLEVITGFKWLQYLNIFLILILFFYLYKAMRNFYEQSRLKIILKYLLLLFSFFFAVLLLFVIFIFISVLQI